MKKTFQGLSLLIVLIILPILVVFLQFNQDNRQRASEAETIYVLPSSVSASPGEPFSIDIMVKIDTLPINGVTASVTYPSIKLAVKEIDVRNSAFTQEVENIAHSGLIQITRASISPLNGTKHVATVHFTVKEPVTAAEILSAPGATVTKSEDNTALPIGTQILTPGDATYVALKSGSTREENQDFIEGILSFFTGR